MSRTTREKRASFRKLHESGCFLLPNPWDVGSARMLEHLGFDAIASTSAGFAWPDYGLPRDEILTHLRELSRAVDIPVNADFEAGFGVDPEGVAESVTLAIAAGVAGLSIEDRDVTGTALYETAMSLERLRDGARRYRPEGSLCDARAHPPPSGKPSRSGPKFRQAPAPTLAVNSPF